MNIHSTAIIHAKARLHPSVRVGPYTIIGEEVEIGADVEIHSHVVIDGITQIGEGCIFYPHSSIGLPPQDLKFKGEPTRLIIGKKNTFREYVTLNRGTKPGGGQTVIGDDNFFMAYCHVAHDTIMGSHIVMANAATLGGHITVGDYAVLGGLAAVHQFVRIGAHALIAGGTIVVQDIPPFVIASGNRSQLHGLNRIGLKRHGFSTEQIGALKAVYKMIFRSSLPLREAVKQARERWSAVPEVEAMLSFVESSKRGICR
jgi:UDP-N-acetylglucosamine acyltransferase